MRNATLLSGLLYLLACACATPTPPQGGPRDTEAPKLVLQQSTPNGQVNFIVRPIEIAFDEWVQLEEVSTQVLVSPPLEFRPQLRIRKRSVIFEFDPREKLRPNVTYAINFGTAVKDLTEKNVVENLRFVFSTGPNLDSLSLKGNIRDAVTGDPVEKALFMLYDNLADSVVRKERPLYFAKTDKEGYFQINNIRAGTFKGFALLEVNGNYRFDLPNEKIGFPDTPIVVAADMETALVVDIFEESPAFRRIGVDTAYGGLAKIFFNLPPLRIQAEHEAGKAIWQAIEKDTLFVWTAPENSGKLIFQRDNAFRDTLVLPPNRTGKPLPPLLVAPRPNERGVRQHPFEDFTLEVSAPLKYFDTAAIVLQADTSLERVMPSVFIDEADARILHIRTAWRENLTYRLEIRPGAFFDIFGRSTDTSIVYAITPIPAKSYGNILLKISGLDSTYAHILELVANGGSIVSKLLPAGVTAKEVAFRGIFPQAYSLRLVEDRNGNGQWDSGSYAAKSQPEPIFSFELEPMRANWDLEAEVTVKR
jgi:hypothetical protein